MDITVGFSKPKKFKLFAWLIMKGFNTPFDHVYIKVHSDSYDRDIIYQASATMVNFMSPVIFTANNDIVDEFEVSITPENQQALMQFAIDNAGKPYGIKEAIGIAIVRIAELMGKKIKNPLGNAGKTTYVCSELVGHMLTKYTDADIPEDVDDVTPRNLYEFLKSIKP